MANEQNLKRLTPSEARTIGSKGGKASAEARRQKRDLKRAIDILLEQDITAKDGRKMCGAEALAAAQFKKALKGDTRAFESLRDTAGQKPVEKLVVAELDQSVIDEVEEAILNDTE